MFAVVVAIDQQRGIGAGNDLPWPKLPADLAHFRDITSQTRAPGTRNAVIMGRRTWDSVPPRYRPLPRRLNVVISRHPPTLPAGVLAAGSLDAALAEAASAGAEATFVVGGGQIYEGALAHPACTTLYVTRLEATFACDTFFPPFEHAYARAEVMAAHEEAGIAYTIERWQRR